MDRRVDVPQGPFVGWDLAIGVHVPLAQKQRQLVFGKVRVDEGERDAVERQIPGGVPGVFPLIGHGDDVFVIQVPPGVIPAALAFSRWRWPQGVAGQPAAHFIMIKLLAP